MAPVESPLPSRSASTSTIESSSVSVQNSTASPLRRKRFDDRSQTSVALQLRARQTGSSATVGIAALSSQLSEASQDSSNANAVIKWSVALRICKILNSSEFLAKLGCPTTIELSPNHIVLGTDNGYVVGFSYHQELSYILEASQHGSIVPQASGSRYSPDLEIHGSDGPRPQDVENNVNTLPDTTTSQKNPITCLSVSSNGSSIVAGCLDGSIVVWDISSTSSTSTSKTHMPIVLHPTHILHPILLRESRSGNAEGHLQGVSVNNVSFMGDSHQHFVSSDVSGQIFFHYCFSRFFRHHSVSSKLLGREVAPETPVAENPVHDWSILPIGTVPQITDHIGVIAIISSNLLLILSVRSLNNTNALYLKSHYKVTRPNGVSLLPNQPPLGRLAWYPCIKKHQSSGVYNAKLAYSWNNVITILELHNSSISPNAMAVLADMRDKDKAIPELPFSKSARYISTDSNHQILALKWLNSEMLTALIRNNYTAETKTSFFYYANGKGQRDLTLVAVDNLDLNVASFKDGETPLFKPSFCILSHRPVVLLDSRSPSSKSLVTGKLAKWADNLGDLIRKKDFVTALITAFDYYSSQKFGLLILNGLPHTTAERHQIVEPFIIDIMRESATDIFARENDKSKLEALLRVFLHLIAVITKDRGGVVGDDFLEIIEMILESVSNRRLFFSILEEFILDKRIRNLSPVVFKTLVESFVQWGQGEQLTEIVCVLDTKTLNIDMTLRLCEEHNLRECIVYIWNTVLKDYSTPFMRLIADMDSPVLTIEEKALVFTYMSYLMSGRQFPSDKFMSYGDEQLAQNALCEILFSSKEFENPLSCCEIQLDKQSIFPYLYKFLKFDSFETLATINEFFENPNLNTETRGKLNRQYIMDMVIDIYDTHTSSFGKRDFTQLAIFIARNYPKYFQFIRISDSVLEQTVRSLCECEEELHGDCELALECILPVYNVTDDGFFLEQVKKAKFYRVALNLCKSKRKYSKALEVWVEKQKHGNFADVASNFVVFAEIVASTYKNSNPAEKAELLSTIKNNFNNLISQVPRDMVALANTYNPEIHNLVLTCDQKLAYQYLHELFNVDSRLAIKESTSKLLARYIELMCTYSEQGVFDFVSLYSEDLLKFPTELQGTEEKLREHDFFDALAVLLEADKQYTRALETLSEGIVRESTAGNLDRVKKYIYLGISVCDQESDNWVTLLDTLVALDIQPRSDMSKTVSEGIYQSFRKIIDKGQRDSDPELFTHVLQRVMDKATLYTMRKVLQETLTSFYFETQIHNITLTKINNGIKEYMQHVKASTLLGWMVKDKLCTSCGKIMWGPEASPRHAIAWETKEKSKLFFGDFDKNEYDDCELVLFKCSHGYHTKCLSGLSSLDKCVICTSE